MLARHGRRGRSASARTCFPGNVENLVQHATRAPAGQDVHEAMTLPKFVMLVKHAG